MSTRHIPVLLDSVLATLGDIGGRTIVDATFGAGGYSLSFLRRGAKVIAFDRDPSVAPAALDLAREFGERFRFINAPFSEIANLKPNAADAIVFDLGVSSMQIDAPERGFSWRFDAPLDMRMGAPSAHSAAPATAADLIKESSVAELSRILREYGDVKKAGAIARAMKGALPRTTFELRGLIHNPKNMAPVFQALRIAVNDELGEIGSALDSAPELLSKGGICACVTFHSLEDRLVKSKFRDWTTAKGDPRLTGLGACGSEHQAKFELLKTFRPSAAELSSNPRARSAHLRAVRKI
jgi:16S rRNA (cytosine1402-N4)-methyltransferase